jgi:hypothetical protein
VLFNGIGLVTMLYFLLSIYTSLSLNDNTKHGTVTLIISIAGFVGTALVIYWLICISSHVREVKKREEDNIEDATDPKNEEMEMAPV